MKTPSRLQSEIEYYESLIIELRDKIRDRNNFVGFLQVRQWRRMKRNHRKTIKELQKLLQMSSQNNTFG